MLFTPHERRRHDVEKEWWSATVALILDQTPATTMPTASTALVRRRVRQCRRGVAAKPPRIFQLRASGRGRPRQYRGCLCVTNTPGLPGRISRICRTATSTQVSPGSNNSVQPADAGALPAGGRHLDQGFQNETSQRSGRRRCPRHHADAPVASCVREKSHAPPRQAAKSKDETCKHAWGITALKRRTENVET